MTTNTNFYKDLRSFPKFSDFSDLNNYTSLPDDWKVVITDIQGSTKAIEKGLYREVNSVSTASVVSVLNVFQEIKLPFVFGGDGATLCIPPQKEAEVQSALAASKKLALESFDLKLRIGIVPMKVIRQNNQQVLIGKFKPSSQFQQAMFQGNGLRFAESLVKQDLGKNPYLIADNVEANGSFEGFECRWNEIPSHKEETVAIMIQTLSEDEKQNKQIYEEVSENIDLIYGNEESCHPIKSNKLSLSYSFSKLSIETKIRNLSQSFWTKLSYLIKIWSLTSVGKYLMAKNIKTENTSWGDYKKNFILNTDYRKFDETLRMVISGTQEQRKALNNYLDKLYKQGKIIFGIHPSSGAIATCIVSDYDKNHVHFIDGSNGGYAMAALNMKEQMKNSYSCSSTNKN